MINYLYLLIFILIIIILLLGIKTIRIYIILNKINDDLNNILNNDTNNIVTISTTDKNIKRFANKLNIHLKKIRTIKIKYEHGNNEIQSCLTNISHDLRTPLTGIKGYVDLIKKNGINKSMNNYFTIIESNTETMINLTEQLFDFSKFLDRKSVV